MKYNLTHKEYRIGLDLWFKVTKDHSSARGTWVCLSNIPGMDLKRLEATNEQDAALEVSARIQSELNFNDEDTIFSPKPVQQWGGKHIEL